MPEGGEHGLRSKLWVYTRKTDMLYTSSDNNVQEQYTECVFSSHNPSHTIVCILEYLLDRVDFSFNIRSDTVYLVPYFAYHLFDHHQGIILNIRTDRCSFTQVVAVGHKRGLTYNEALKVIRTFVDIDLIPIIPTYCRVISYEKLRLLVKTFNKVPGDLLLGEKEFLIPCNEAEKQSNCTPLL